jgi:hypothetical protein
MTPQEAARIVQTLKWSATTRDRRDRRKAVRLTDRELEALDVLLKAVEVSA